MADKFNLYGVTVEVDDMVVSDAAPIRPTSVRVKDVSGYTTALGPSLVTIELKVGQIFEDTGQYTFEVTSDDTANMIIASKTSTGEVDVKNVPVNKVERTAIFLYKGDV